MSKWIGVDAVLTKELLDTQSSVEEEMAKALKDNTTLEQDENGTFKGESYMTNSIFKVLKKNAARVKEAEMKAKTTVNKSSHNNNNNNNKPQDGVKSSKPNSDMIAAVSVESTVSWPSTASTSVSLPSVTKTGELNPEYGKTRYNYLDWNKTLKGVSLSREQMETIWKNQIGPIVGNENVLGETMIERRSRKCDMWRFDQNGKIVPSTRTPGVCLECFKAAEHNKGVKKAGEKQWNGCMGTPYLCGQSKCVSKNCRRNYGHGENDENTDCTALFADGSQLHFFGRDQAKTFKDSLSESNNNSVNFPLPGESSNDNKKALKVMQQKSRDAVAKVLLLYINLLESFRLCSHWASDPISLRYDSIETINSSTLGGTTNELVDFTLPVDLPNLTPFGEFVWLDFLNIPPPLSLSFTVSSSSLSLSLMRCSLLYIIYAYFNCLLYFAYYALILEDTGIKYKRSFYILFNLHC